MTILIVEDDGHLTELMRTVLAGGGAEVSVVDEVAMAIDLVRVTRPDAVLVNALVKGTSGLLLVRALRGLNGGDQIRVLMHTAFPDPVLREECAALGVERLLTRPFSMLDVAAMISNPPERSSLPTPPPAPEPSEARPAAPRFDATNLGQIVRLWARRANGILQMEVGGEPAWVMLAAGGPLDDDGMAAIHAVLGGGEIDFQPCDVEGEGLHAALANLVWQVAWDASVGADAERLANHVPSRNRLSEATETLPLPLTVRTLLRYVSQGVSFGVLVEEHGLEPVGAARGVQALAHLGLLGLAAPAEAPRARTVAREEQRAEPEIESTGRTTRDLVTVRRLRREVALLKDADPWVVLGVPKDAPGELLGRAASRMTTRYQEFSRDGDPQVRELGATLLERIRWATKSLSHGIAGAAEARPPSSEDEAFRSGQRAMTLGDWSAADKWFSSAHELNLDSARNLAHLGWARLHNPDLPLQERVEEGVDLLLLAEQLDADNADGQYFLAVALHRQGDDDGALKRIRRALRAQPDHVAASALARKLRRPPANPPPAR